jgi:branched-chain amino acid transport system substrate-binding protein
MRSWRKFIIPCAAVAILATACGDDDDDDGASATTAGTSATTTAATSAATTATTAGTTAGGSGGATTTTASDLKLTAPVKIIGLWEIKGESSAAIPYFEDGAQMALEEINAAGGIGGQKIDYKRIAMGPTDAAQIETATLQAIDAKPNVILGFVSSNQIIAQAPKVTAAKIPTITMTAAAQSYKDYTGQGGVGSDFIFVGRPRNVDQATVTAQYAIDTFKPTKVALQCVNNPFGQQTCDAYKAVLDKAGVEIVAEEKNETTDTDLSAQVLAIKEAGPDLILDANFPNPLIAFANQLIENDVKVPHLDGSSAGIGFASGNIEPAALEFLHGVDDCVPTIEQKEWAAEYKAKYGYDPNYQSAETYDLVHIVKDAIERAGSADPIEIQKALATMDYEGICTTYKPDAGNGIHHNTAMLGFKGGTITVEKSIPLPGA